MRTTSHRCGSLAKPRTQNLINFSKQMQAYVAPRRAFPQGVMLMDRLERLNHEPGVHSLLDHMGQLESLIHYMHEIAAAARKHYAHSTKIDEGRAVVWARERRAEGLQRFLRGCAHCVEWVFRASGPIQHEHLQEMDRRTNEIRDMIGDICRQYGYLPSYPKYFGHDFTDALFARAKLHMLRRILAAEIERQGQAVTGSLREQKQTADELGHLLVLFTKDTLRLRHLKDPHGHPVDERAANCLSEISANAKLSVQLVDSLIRQFCAKG